jgi:hypothetical protein
MLEQVLDDIVIEAQALRLPSVCQAAEAAKGKSVISTLRIKCILFILLSFILALTLIDLMITVK